VACQWSIYPRAGLGSWDQAKASLSGGHPDRVDAENATGTFYYRATLFPLQFIFDARDTHWVSATSQQGLHQGVGYIVHEVLNKSDS
jgi:hypothetical protein